MSSALLSIKFSSAGKFYYTSSLLVAVPHHSPWLFSLAWLNDLIIKVTETTWRSSSSGNLFSKESIPPVISTSNRENFIISTNFHLRLFSANFYQQFLNLFTFFIWTTFSDNHFLSIIQWFYTVYCLLNFLFSFRRVPSFYSSKMVAVNFHSPS